MGYVLVLSLGLNLTEPKDEAYIIKDNIWATAYIYGDRASPGTSDDGDILVESMAILQYLEDTRPEPTLTPSTPLLRARMREICETIVSGIQPLQNVGLKRLFPTEEEYQNFAQESTERGLQTLEVLLRKSAGRYCVKDQITMADLCLVPQLFNATTRLKLDIGKYEIVSKLYENLINEKLFQQTHPTKNKPKK